MPIVRDLTLRLMPARWRDAAIAETKTWTATCGGCGHSASLWDLGALRWKAAGRPKVMLRCPACGRVGWHTLART